MIKLFKGVLNQLSVSHSTYAFAIKFSMHFQPIKDDDISSNERSGDLKTHSTQKPVFLIF